MKFITSKAMLDEVCLRKTKLLPTLDVHIMSEDA